MNIRGANAEIWFIMQFSSRRVWILLDHKPLYSGMEWNFPVSLEL